MGDLMVRAQCFHCQGPGFTKEKKKIAQRTMNLTLTLRINWDYKPTKTHKDRKTHNNIKCMQSKNCVILCQRKCDV